MRTKIACIVPAFNETRSIAKVLRTLSRIQLDQLICVDDGSTDGTAALVRRAFPRVALVPLARNGGKAAAVRAGLVRVHSDYVLLADADLRNPSTDDFVNALKAVRKDPAIDMLVLRRVNKDLLTRAVRGDLLISGERIVRTRDLRAFYQQTQIHGFQLEVALNQYMLERGKQVRWLPISSVGVVSLKKRGLMAGIRKEIDMFRSIFAYLGLRKLLWQMLAFACQRA